jgi:nicotinate-nucleotide adenylyltransferase
VRLGLFGGTFDPPHVGHLLVASDACDALRLDRVVFIPNARQPLKSDERQATARERLAMTRLMATGDARLYVDSCEAERGGVSFSVDTLEAFAAKSPADERYFLVGTDIIRTFAQWKSPDRVAQLARLAVLRRRDEGAVERPGWGTALGEGAAEPDAASVLQEIGRVAGPAALQPLIVPTRRVDVSSTEIRDRVRTGRSIHGFVTEAVEQFIHEHRLYR